MEQAVINNSMRIQEIVKEFVEPGQADANKTTLDSEVKRRKELEVAAQDGVDLEAEEVTQDLPS